MNKAITGRLAILAFACTLSVAAHADHLNYSQDFEGMIPGENTIPNTLSMDDWQVGGNVYNPAGDLVGSYFAFPAPNGGPAFSGVVDDQGGDDQGFRQLSIYNDYNNAAHSNASGNTVEAIVLRDIGVITEDDVGQTYGLSFDTKRGNILAPTTTAAYIKVLDSSFALLANQEVDTTPAACDGAECVWTESGVTLEIIEAYVGSTLQIGFLSRASNGTDSGVFYDNVNLAPVAVADEDLDGVADATDNCTAAANPNQEDTDGDGFGNACDADIFGDNCLVNLDDLGVMRNAFFSTPASPNWNPDADFVGNPDGGPGGSVNLDDLAIMRVQFFGQPGPSAQASCVTSRLKN